MPGRDGPPVPYPQRKGRARPAPYPPPGPVPPAATPDVPFPPLPTTGVPFPPVGRRFPPGGVRNRPWTWDLGATPPRSRVVLALVAAVASGLGGLLAFFAYYVVAYSALLVLLFGLGLVFLPVGLFFGFLSIGLVRIAFTAAAVGWQRSAGPVGRAVAAASLLPGVVVVMAVATRR